MPGQNPNRKTLLGIAIGLAIALPLSALAILLWNGAWR